MSESKIVYEIRIGTGMRPKGRYFRNNVGTLLDKNGRPVKFGLCEGSGDIIGIESIEITPDMVGKNIGVFVSIEVKREGKDTTSKSRKESQRRWSDMIRSMGGRAGIARNLDDAIKIIEGKM